MLITGFTVSVKIEKLLRNKSRFRAKQNGQGKKGKKISTNSKNTHKNRSDDIKSLVKSFRGDISTRNTCQHDDGISDNKTIITDKLKWVKNTFKGCH